MIETMKVKPWGEGQGDHVIINAEDFDPAVHTPFDAPDAPKAGKPAPRKPTKRKAKK